MISGRMRRVVCLAAGGVVIAAAVGPPLHEPAEELFALHMVQHLLLVIVAAPLLGAGLPGFELLTWLPLRPRHVAARWLRRTRRLLSLTRIDKGYPVIAWVLHVAILWVWHVPVLYEAALRSAVFHALEHVSLLASATAFWAVVARPHGRRALGVTGRLLYLFTAAGQSTALGALLTLTNHPAYPIHAATAPRWGLTALDDQHLAGLVMWVLGGLGYLLAALLTVVRTIREAEAPRNPASAIRAEVRR